MYERIEFFEPVSAGPDYPVPLPLPPEDGRVHPSARALAAANEWEAQFRRPPTAAEWERWKRGAGDWLEQLRANRPPQDPGSSVASWAERLRGAMERMAAASDIVLDQEE